METADTNFNPIVHTYEQYQEMLKDEKKAQIKAKHATSRAKNILRAAAWFCMALSLLSAIYFNDEVTALLNLGMAVACVITIKRFKQGEIYE